jgi:type II secretory pathway pseudopilin PulG
MHNILLRPAIAMIELIFAIVIMAIVLLSAPQLIRTSTQSGYVAIQQEAINEAAAQVNLVLGYNWDEGNTDEIFLPSILKVTNGDPNLNEVGTTGRRAGTPTQSYRSFYRADGNDTNASPIGSDGGDMDDMDDFNGANTLIEIENASSDYIETDTINIATTVRYGSDRPVTGTGPYNTLGGDTEISYSPNFNIAATPTTNIKFITVRLTSTSPLNELDKNITFNAFSANIGGYELEERIY